MVPYLIITILAFAGLNVMYKVSQVRKCETWVFLGGLYVIGAASSIIGLVSHRAVLDVPMGVWIIGVAAGAAGVVCLLCLFESLKLGGKLSLVIVITQLSLGIPIIYAMLFLSERVTPLRVVGLLLFVVFVILLNEPVKANSEEAS